MVFAVGTRFVLRGHLARDATDSRGWRGQTGRCDLAFMDPDEIRARNDAKLKQLQDLAKEIEEPADLDLSGVTDHAERLQLQLNLQHDRNLYIQQQSINLLMQMALQADSAIALLAQRVERLERVHG